MATLRYLDPLTGAWVELGIGGSGGGDGSDVRIFDFPNPSTSWTINAGSLIGAIVVVDSAGTVVEPGTIVHSGTTATLEFSASFSGRAYVVCS